MLSLLSLVKELSILASITQYKFKVSLKYRNYS